MKYIKLCATFQRNSLSWVLSSWFWSHFGCETVIAIIGTFSCHNPTVFANSNDTTWWKDEILEGNLYIDLEISIVCAVAKQSCIWLVDLNYTWIFSNTAKLSR